MSTENDVQETGEQEVSTPDTRTMEQIFDDLQAEKSSEETQDSEQSQEESSQEESKDESTQEKEEDLLAPKFAALSRKEKSIRQKEKELEDRIKEIEERTENESSIVELAKKDPMKALNELGLTYSQLTDFVLNGGEIPEEKEDPRIAELNKRIEEMETKTLEKEKTIKEKELDQVVMDYKNEIRNAIESNESLKISKAYGEEAVDLALQLSQIHYEQEGRILDIDEALQAVESYAKEEVNKQLENYKKLGLIPAATTEENLQSKKDQSVTKQEKEVKNLSSDHQTDVPQKERKVFKDELEELFALSDSNLRWND